MEYRKTIITFLILCLFLGTAQPVYASSGIDLSVYKQQYEDVEMTGKNVDLDRVIKKDGKITKKQVRKVKSVLLDMLRTKEALTYFCEDGWEITITDKPIIHKNISCAGIILYQKKCIRLRNSEVYYAAEHEMMHYIHYIYNRYLCEDRTYDEKLFEMYSGHFQSGESKQCTKYAKTDVWEYIASAFEFRNNRKCRESAPEALEFVYQIIQEVRYYSGEQVPEENTQKVLDREIKKIPVFHIVRRKQLEYSIIYSGWC